MRHSFLPTKPFAHSNPAPPLTCGTGGVFRRIVSTAVLIIISAVLLTADAMMEAVSPSGSLNDAVTVLEVEDSSVGSCGSNHAVWKSKSETTRMARRREQ